MKTSTEASPSWVDEYEKDTEREGNGGFWGRLERQWEELIRNESSPQPWLSEFKQSQDYKWVWSIL